MTAYFITSTGTGIGKTYLACSVIEALRRRDLPVDAIKPVISGFDPDEADDSDTGLILRALGLPIDALRIQEISPWRFRAALSPDMAAQQEGKAVRLDELVAFCGGAIADDDSITLIEGAGGLMAPIGTRLHESGLDWGAGRQDRSGRGELSRRDQSYADGL